jgi:hypothetical protein
MCKDNKKSDYFDTYDKKSVNGILLNYTIWKLNKLKEFHLLGYNTMQSYRKNMPSPSPRLKSKPSMKHVAGSKKKKNLVFWLLNAGLLLCLLLNPEDGEDTFL